MNEVIESILNLLRTNLGGAYKKYYYGEIRVASQMAFPMIEVIPNTSRITNRGTGGMTNNDFDIIIVVKSTLKKYLGGNKGEKLNHTQDLVKRIEERDTDGTIKSTTVLGVLHDNLKLIKDGVRFADINDNWEVDYEESDLGDSYIVQATISFTVKRIN